MCSNCRTENPPTNSFCGDCGQPLTKPALTPAQESPTITEPTSFVNGRYQVIKKLGEGGKKKAYLVHDTKLDRDVAFALIKTENLNETSRERVTREAKAMGKLGDHPNIMPIHELGETNGQPYMVMPNMPGINGDNDVEKLIEHAPDHKLPLDQVIRIAKDVCKGLEFAHSKGAIHRDIKPGNIWLTEDGTAKIGDFGLAVMTDVSRLTQEGMMVGTPNYLSPEQAGAGEVTYKSDLYSLGAMLYEMVTGRPPFVGEDSYAVIGGHLNTQPILPTWHRIDLLPAFESLIMLLLEKDPDKRPSSAKNVLQVLESIEKGDIKESTVEQQVPTENPIYRRIFVGRENELKQLQNAFVSAMSGQGSLTMVVGEPGIGKTALCEQLSTYVTLRGGMTLVGNCYEEGSLSLPYLAFVEAMRSYVIDREPDELKKELGSGASDVARIVSDVREKLKVEPRASENPEEDRYRLMQAVTSFLSNAAAVKPILVILEDLHDADKGTLEMLSYVSRNLARVRVLLVGTYRDVEVDRNHPLSAALAELRRVASFSRVLLRGLNINEVRRMLVGITHEEVPIGLAEAVHRQTEGNPLFVQEVVRYLTEEKLLRKTDGKMITNQTALEMNIPEGLRDVIGKRLSNLSSECNGLLSIAAVIGREFRPDVLQKVSGLSEDEVYSSIEEAMRVAVVEERSSIGATVTYRFAHAFFRTILYEENIAPRRIRLHQQVARALEEVYASRLQEHAAELAEHFSYSSEATDLTKAVEYGEMAARRATDVFDDGEAARLLQQAVKVQEVLDPENKEKLCDLLLALGEARVYSGETSHALDVEAPGALSLAEAIDDKERISKSCFLALSSIGWASALTSIAGPQAAKWIETAEYYATPGTLQYGYANHFKGVRSCMRGFNEEGIPLIKNAREIAKGLDNPQLLMWTGVWLLTFGITPWAAEELLQLLEEMKPVYDQRIRINITYPVSALLGCGKRRQAEDMIPIGRELADRTGWLIDIAYVKNAEAIIAFLDGHLEESIEILEDMIELAHDSDYQGTISTIVLFTGLRPLLYLGDSDEVHYRSVQKVIEENMTTPVFRYIPLYQAHQGQIEEVNKLLERMLERRPNITTRDDLTQAYIDIAYLESAVLAGHHKVAELLLERFKDNTLATASHHWLTCIARHLGAAAAMLERYDEAKKHYEQAIKVCAEMNFRPELALSRLQLAELLLDHYPDEKAEAIKHLDFSIKEFREMKMQPSLERALRRKDILKA